MERVGGAETNFKPSQNWYELQERCIVLNRTVYPNSDCTSLFTCLLYTFSFSTHRHKLKPFFLSLSLSEGSGWQRWGAQKQISNHGRTGTDFFQFSVWKNEDSTQKRLPAYRLRVIIEIRIPAWCVIQDEACSTH